jgi:hypothetical protein
MFCILLVTFYSVGYLSHLNPILSLAHRSVMSAWRSLVTHTSIM